MPVRVYGLDLSENPAECSSTALAMPRSACSDVEKNRFNSVILSALMANKKIRLKLLDSECEQGYPVYYAVRVEQN